MSGRCTFVHDHDPRSREVAAHVATCERCAESLALGKRARQAWQQAMLRDDATGRSARERRLKSIGGVRRTREGRFAPYLPAVSLVAALAAAAWIVHDRSLSTSREPRTSTPVAVAPALAESSPAAEPAVAAAGFRVMEVDGGGTDANRRRLEVGRTLLSGDTIDVPKGGSVDLGYLVDTSSRIGIFGPAEADVREEHSSALLFLRRGTARARAVRGAAVATETVETRGEHASWVVEVTAQRTRVNATEGTVAVEATASAEPPREVSAGHAVAIESGRLPSPIESRRSRSSIDTTPSRSETASADASTEATDKEEWRAAEAALDDGDRAGAEALLRDLTAREGDPSARARAGLKLAELLLARGANDEARPLLEPLVLGHGSRTAADAAWLYARSFRDPRERADAWARYLATDPVTPMRQVARVERARELAAAGDRATAQAIVQSLQGETLSPVAADALANLKAKLRSGGP